MDIVFGGEGINLGFGWGGGVLYIVVRVLACKDEVGGRGSSGCVIGKVGATR